jgi:outer membrane biosynthesis protein TonB
MKNIQITKTVFVYMALLVFILTLMVSIPVHAREGNGRRICFPPQVNGNECGEFEQPPVEEIAEPEADEEAAQQIPEPSAQTPKPRPTSSPQPQTTPVPEPQTAQIQAEEREETIDEPQTTGETLAYVEYMGDTTPPADRFSQTATPGTTPNASIFYGLVVATLISATISTRLIIQTIRERA